MIQVQGLEFSYGDRRVLNGVSLDIPKGTIFGMLGPNGSGKTTLFRILSTLLAPQKGSATWFGHNLFTDADAVRQTLGIVFQNPSLDAQLTVEENLKCQGALYSMSGHELKERIATSLKEMDIWDRRNERVKVLSGGLKRRAELAKALLHNPQVLLMDEPSTGLDPRARSEFWKLLLELNQKRKMTILVTTHLMEEAEKCSQLVILDQGKIIAQGAPAELKLDLSKGYVLIETSDTQALQEQIKQDFKIIATEVDRGLRVDSENPQKLILDLMNKYSGQVNEIAFHKASLEDVFLKKTGRSFGSNQESVHAKS